MIDAPLAGPEADCRPVATSPSATQVLGCRAALEEILQSPAQGFAYPYGSFTDEVLSAVREAGFGYACATDDHTRPGRYTIARFYVGDNDQGLRLEAKFIRHRFRALARAAAS